MRKLDLKKELKHFYAPSSSAAVSRGAPVLRTPSHGYTKRTSDRSPFSPHDLLTRPGNGQAFMRLA